MQVFIAQIFIHNTFNFLTLPRYIRVTLHYFMDLLNPHSLGVAEAQCQLIYSKIDVLINTILFFLYYEMKSHLVKILLTVLA